MVQEAFLNAYQSLDNFKGDAQFFTWLYRIAINAAISHKRKRRVVLSIDTVARNGEAVAYPIRQLAYHHLVQDMVGRVPIVVTY